MLKITRHVMVFVTAVVGSAMIALVSLGNQVPWDAWPQLLLFTCMIVFAISVRVPDPRGGVVTPSSVLSYLAIYVLNPPTALLVVGLGKILGDAISRPWVPWRALFNGTQMGLSVAIGASVYELLGGSRVSIAIPSDLPALIAGPLAHQLANNFFVAYAVSRMRRTPLLDTWLNGVRDLLWPNLLSIPTAIALAFLYSRVHYTAVLVYLGLLPLQLMALRLYIKRRQLYAQIVDGLVVATDANFPLSRGHGRRVADLAVAIAREMRLSESSIESVQFAALLHDVGMIGKDDLLDGRTLGIEETDDLRDHVRVGAEIARELPRKEIADLILYHHERYDGSGYPEGLRGEAIPLGSRIIAVAEEVDSMASGLFPYAAPMAVPGIAAHVEGERGRGFDPDVVDALLRTLERGAVTVESQPRVGGAMSLAPGLGGQPAR